MEKNKQNTKQETKVVEKETPKIIVLVGTVVGCERLNFRQEPNLNSKILGEFASGTKLKVQLSFTGSTDFYQIISDKIVGYAMKKYISIPLVK